MSESASKKRSLLIWLTGLSNAGKTTTAYALVPLLLSQGRRIKILDGDEMRRGLCRGLGFSLSDRAENVRRIGEAALLFLDEGYTVIAACISPMRESRNEVRKRVAPHLFIEIYLNCPLDVCMKRDAKGIYEQAQRNQLPDFTGLNSPYEPPLTAELELRTDLLSVGACVETIARMLPG